MPSHNQMQSHLLRLSSRAGKFFRRFRSTRRSTDCQPSNCSEQSAPREVSPSNSNCSDEQSALREVSPSNSNCIEQSALREVSPSNSNCSEQSALDSSKDTEEVEEPQDDDTDYESGGKMQAEPWRLDKSERHLTSIRYALLLEHDKSRRVLFLADAREFRELEAMKRKREAELKEWMESESDDEDLFTLWQRKAPTKESFNSDFFDSELELRRHWRGQRGWRMHWSLRASNRMHGGRSKYSDYEY